MFFWFLCQCIIYVWISPSLVTDTINEIELKVPGVLHALTGVVYVCYPILCSILWSYKIKYQHVIIGEYSKWKVWLCAWVERCHSNMGGMKVESGPPTAPSRGDCKVKFQWPVRHLEKTDTSNLKNNVCLRKYIPLFLWAVSSSLGVKSII